MLKNSFKDDYSRFLRLNGKGRVVDDICYIGDYYILPLDERQKKKTNLVNIGFAAVFFLIQIAMGMVNQDSSRTFWIVYPYLFIFLPVAYFFVGAASYWSDPLRMQKAQYETGIARMRRSCIGAAFLAVFSAVLDVIYMLQHLGSMRLGRELLYLLCHILFLAAAFLYGKYYNKAYGGLRIEKSEHKAE